jgi:CspA family cold shock protein
MKETDVAQGTVKWFDVESGVGVISSDDGGTEVVVHQSEIDGGGRQSLRAHQRVTFTVDDGSAGTRAVGVYSP